MGRVLGLDRAPEVKTIRRKLGELAAAAKAAGLIMALARRHADTRPEALGFLYADGHARACYGTRNVQKTHVARLKFPAPATAETSRPRDRRSDEFRTLRQSCSCRRCRVRRPGTSSVPARH